MDFQQRYYAQRQADADGYNSVVVAAYFVDMAILAITDAWAAHVQPLWHGVTAFFA